MTVVLEPISTWIRCGKYKIENKTGRRLVIREEDKESNEPRIVILGTLNDDAVWGDE